MKTLCNELEEVKHKAYEIGVQLGIPPWKLKQFKQEMLLSEALEFWLNGNAPEVPINWSYLVAALSSKQVGKTGLSEAIHKKYCTDQKSKTSKGIVIAKAT